MWFVLSMIGIEPGSIWLITFGGEGHAWDEAMRFFDRSWNKIVLKRLQYHFFVGIIDWTAPPEMTDQE